MSLLMSDRKDELSKPPPKKKWLQNYIEEDNVRSPIGLDLRNETQKFVQLLKPQSNEGLKQFKAANTPTKLTLSQDVIGGVVQGVIEQFHNFFENDLLGNQEDSQSGPGQPSFKASEEPEPPSEPPKLLQKDIQPVVQSVISQFLNGSLSDSGFRRSRKRSHKHINSRYKDKSGSSSYNTSESLQRRASSVIQLRKPSQEFTNQIKVRKIETLMNPNLGPDGNEEALNLSCPKKVTFAAEDRCYSNDSVKSFQSSKSGEIQGGNISNPSANWKMGESKLYFQEKRKARPTSTPVIFYNKSREATPLCQPQPLNLASIAPPAPPAPPQLAKLPSSRQTSPGLSGSESGVAPLNLTKQPARKVFNNFLGSKPALSASVERSSESPKGGSREREGSKDEIKKTSTNTREVHNRLEKNRRAHLKACFDSLASECNLEPRKASNLMVIRSAYKCIMALRREEREQEKNLAALVQEKIKRQSQLNELKREFPGFGQDYDSD